MMSTPTNPHPTAKSSPLCSVFDDEVPVPDIASNDSSYKSSSLSASADLRSPLAEENEKVNSEAIREQLVATKDHLPQIFQACLNDSRYTSTKAGGRHSRPSLTIDTSNIMPLQLLTIQDKTTLTERPDAIAASSKSLSTAMEDLNINKTAPTMITTCNSLDLAHLKQPLSTTDRLDLVSGHKPRHLSIQQGSLTNTLCTNVLNSSTLPNSPIAREQKHHLAVAHEKQDGFLNTRRKKRSATGLSVRDRFHFHKVTFGAHPHDSKQSQHTHRSTSVGHDRAIQNKDESDLRSNDIQQISRQVWGMAAETGIGLKARRLSLQLPDNFNLEVVDLYTEYAEQSRFLGWHGKSVGKGASANVRLIHRKGAHSGELYAAKEFRGKSSKERADEYEKKVKSEYSIAKSVHHPNIVETFCLCTHHGRWIQVMEFCDQGDLFGLVNQKYLAKDDHLVDRLCLFRQLVQGLNYLHNNGIAHRDVKLENLLLTKQSKLKITDFGVSEVFSGLHPGLKSAGGQCGRDMGEVRLCAPGICGSPPYIAPEVIAKQTEYDPRPLDVWGAAIVMLCLCANGCLWEKAVAGSSPIYDSLVNSWAKWNSAHPQGSRITDIDYPRVSYFNSHIQPPALRRLLLTMLNPDPSQRVAMEGVANNRWLKVIECCQTDSFDSEPFEIDASKSPASAQKIVKAIYHNHQPPHQHTGHKLVRLPGSTDK